MRRRRTSRFKSKLVVHVRTTHALSHGFNVLQQAELPQRKHSLRAPPAYKNSRDFFIVLLSFLPTVANARAAARRDIERVLRVETMEGSEIF